MAAWLLGGEQMDVDARLRRLRYRAWHRGFREADLILGPFADAYAETMDEAQLARFEALLTAPDQDLYDWIMERAAAAFRLAQRPSAAREIDDTERERLLSQGFDINSIEGVAADLDRYAQLDHAAPYRPTSTLRGLCWLGATNEANVATLNP